MSFRLQILLVVFIILGMLYILKLISSKKLDFKFGLDWILVLCIILVFAIWPGVLKKVSRFLGIYDPVNMLFLFGLLLLITIIFSLSMEISKLSEQNKKLSQELAILRKDTYDQVKAVEKDIKEKAND